MISGEGSVVPPDSQRWIQRQIEGQDLKSLHQIKEIIILSLSKTQRNPI